MYSVAVSWLDACGRDPGCVVWGASVVGLSSIDSSADWGLAVSLQVERFQVKPFDLLSTVLSFIL